MLNLFFAAMQESKIIQPWYQVTNFHKLLSPSILSFYIDTKYLLSYGSISGPLDFIQTFCKNSFSTPRFF